MRLILGHTPLDRSLFKKTFLLSVVCFVITASAGGFAYAVVAKKVATAVFKSIHNEIILDDTRSVFRSLTTISFFDSVEAYSEDRSFHFKSGRDNSIFHYSIKLIEPQGHFTAIFRWNPFRSLPLLLFALTSAALGLAGGYFFRKREILRDNQVEEYFRLTSLANVSAKVAHDIKSPLTAIKLVSQGMNHENFEESRKILDIAFERLNSMSTQLLCKAKESIVKSQGLKYGSSLEQAKGMFTCEELAFNIENLINEKINEHSLKSDQVIFINSSLKFNGKGSCSEIIRILSNLINNSIESVSLQRKSSIKLSVNLEKTLGRLVISVKDNGSGIKKDGIKNIFKLGYSHKPKGSIGGNGMALYFAYKYMEECEGSINLKSQYGIGTTVSLTFRQF